MWKCGKCGKKYKNDVAAVDVRFGYVGEDADPEDQYASFETDNGWGPLCDKCAVEYIKTGE